MKTVILSSISLADRMFIAVIMFFLLLYSSADAREFGKNYLPASVIYNEDTYYVVFSPRTKISIVNNEDWRWDTCFYKNKNLMHYFDASSVHFEYKINNREQMQVNRVLGKAKSLRYIPEFDCDITDCLNPDSNTDYSGYAICATDGKRKGDYKVFYFTNGKLVKVFQFTWVEFEKFLDWEKEEELGIEDDLLKRNWLNW